MVCEDIATCVPPGCSVNPANRLAVSELAEPTRALSFSTKFHDEPKFRSLFPILPLADW